MSAGNYCYFGSFSRTRRRDYELILCKFSMPPFDRKAAA